MMEAHYRAFPQTDAEWKEHYPIMDSFREAYMAYLTPEDPRTQEHIAMLAYMDELSAFMVQEHARLNTWWRRILRISWRVDKVADILAAWRGS
jgi:hypothetical protein